jgi:hypothetical protein
MKNPPTLSIPRLEFLTDPRQLKQLHRGLSSRELDAFGVYAGSVRQTLRQASRTEGSLVLAAYGDCGDLLGLASSGRLDGSRAVSWWVIRANVQAARGFGATLFSERLRYLSGQGVRELYTSAGSENGRVLIERYGGEPVSMELEWELGEGYYVHYL